MMNRAFAVVAALGVSLALGACSSTPTEKRVRADFSARGPTIVDVQVQPDVVELTPRMQLNEAATVVAQVQDLESEVISVTLRFLNAPVEVPLEHVAGTAWRAEIPEQTVQRLAVNDQTTTYEANIYARNADGQVSSSSEPVEIAIKAPRVILEPPTG